MTAPTRVQSPTPTRRNLTARQSCEVNLDLFDPFDFRNGALCDDEVRRARTAIAACESCPRLAACRADTAATIDGTSRRGMPPVGVVQAGILFDEESRPYGHTPKPSAPRKATTTKGKKSAPAPRPETEPGQGMLDFPDAMSEVLPTVNGTKVDWVPDIDLTPPRVNHRGVHFALGPEALEATATRHWLNQKKQKDFDPGTREILEHHDELEVVRLGVERGQPLHRIASSLRTTWHRVDRMCETLGIDPPHIR